MSSLDELNVTNLKKIGKELKIKGYYKYTKKNIDELKGLIENSDSKENVNKLILKVTSGGDKSVVKKKIVDVEKEVDPDTGEWVRVSQLGKTGKEGKIYLVINEKGDTKAMKIFRKNKNVDSMKREINFQVKASESKYEISPKVIEYNLNGRYIVMNRLDNTLVDILESQNGTLKINQQKEIINLYRKLDNIGIFHNDANPLNIMTKQGKWYMIDYGFSCTCEHKDIVGIKHPNVQFMTVGLVTWLMEKGYDISKYTYLMKFISERVRNKLLK